MSGYAIVDPTGLVIGREEGSSFLNAVNGGGAFGTVVLLKDGETVTVNQTAFIDNEFVSIPPRPAPWATWSGSEWIDPRTPADMQAALYAARDAATREKSDLLMTMMAVGALSQEDARAAARGEVPPSYQAAFDQLPLEAQTYALVKWPSDQIISRNNPMVLLFAHEANITPEQLDEFFGVQTPT
ncbi:MAG: hypothetical protein MEQ74_11870 [Paracoccus sp.]|nr:hypothetical protein [Paracoccus sp. (in: a-proteobacteria)]